jgi:hypothetical protein
LRDEIRDAVVASNVIAPQKHEYFFTGVFAEMPGNPGGRKFFGAQCRFIRPADSGLIGFAR